MHFDPESNVVDVHVGNLRRKLQPRSRRTPISRRCAASVSLALLPRCADAKVGVMAALARRSGAKPPHFSSILAGLLLAPRLFVGS